MKTWVKILALEIVCLIALPVLLGLLLYFFGFAGLFFFLMLVAIWGWELSAAVRYRSCRQEEFLQVLHTATAAQAPVESVLEAYLRDRPRDEWYRFWIMGLLCFVFPGYYFLHHYNSFDARLIRVLRMLHSGYSLDRCLIIAPGLVSQEVGLAVTVGLFSGNLKQALESVPRRKNEPGRIDFAVRLWYPLIILAVLLLIILFLTKFVIPQYEKRLFAIARLPLPETTATLIKASRWFLDLGMISWLVGLLLLVLVNVVLFSSRAKWHFPFFGRLYRMKVRGQFLQTLGIMMETGKPLPDILECLNGSGLLPIAIKCRTQRLEKDVSQGKPLTDSLARRGLLTPSTQSLVKLAEKTRVLPLELQELGASLRRQSYRLSYRIAMVLYPLTIFACAGMVAFVAIAMFTPLISLMESLHVK